MNKQLLGMEMKYLISKKPSEIWKKLCKKCFVSPHQGAANYTGSSIWKKNSLKCLTLNDNFESPVHNSSNVCKIKVTPDYFWLFP